MPEKKSPQDYHFFSPEEVKKILELKEERTKLKEIARKLGLSEDDWRTIYSLCSRIKRGKRPLETRFDRHKSERLKLVEKYLGSDVTQVDLACERGVCHSVVNGQLAREGVDAKIKKELRHKVHVP